MTLTCEHCGKTSEVKKSWVSCPRSFDPICMTCCFGCEWHREAGSLTWCGLLFNQENEKEKGAQTLEAV